MTQVPDNESICNTTAEGLRLSASRLNTASCHCQAGIVIHKPHQLLVNPHLLSGLTYQSTRHNAMSTRFLRHELALISSLINCILTAIQLYQCTTVSTICQALLEGDLLRGAVHVEQAAVRDGLAHLDGHAWRPLHLAAQVAEPGGPVLGDVALEAGHVGLQCCAVCTTS